MRPVLSLVCYSAGGHVHCCKHTVDGASSSAQQRRAAGRWRLLLLQAYWQYACSRYQPSGSSTALMHASVPLMLVLTQGPDPPLLLLAVCLHMQAPLAPQGAQA